MHTHLQSLGWNEHFQRGFETIKDDNLIPARAIRENRGQYIVLTGHGKHTAYLSRALHQQLQAQDLHPTVGDWLAVEPRTATSDYQIRHVLPRKSHFQRQASGKTSEYQSVAANFDYLFLVSGLDGDFNSKRIQRYLSLAWNSGAELVIILNKSDLVDDRDPYLKEVNQVAHQVPVKAISALEPSSLECLRDYLKPGTTIAFLGSSGVGKSSLINALLGETWLTTQAVRQNDSRGRHTTTWRELIQTPHGTLLIDLPGMRELQLTDEGDGIHKTFADIELLAKSCRFRNCRHTDEPGCAVQAAIESGALDNSRFNQYIKLKEENAWARTRRASRKKPLSARRHKRDEKEQFFKEIHQQLRKEAKARRKFFKGKNY